MEKYSEIVDTFLKAKILPKLGFSDYNKSNIGDIVDYLLNEIEIPFSQAEEDGEILTKEDKHLFELASKAITEITTREDW